MHVRAAKEEVKHPFKISEHKKHVVDKAEAAAVERIPVQNRVYIKKYKHIRTIETL